MAGGGSRTTTPVAALLARARPRARTVAAGGAALAVATPLVLAAALGTGHAERLLDQTAGTAWVVSPAQGLVTLLDGGSEDVVAGVRVPGAALTVAQAGAGAYLVDDDAGTVSRLDAATWTSSTPVALGTPGGGLTVLQNDPGPGGRHVVHVLDPQGRTATRVDARTLAVHDEVALTARPSPGQAVVDDAGDLWALDAATGTLTRVAADDVPRTVRRTDAATTTARLVLVRGAPVLVDPADGSSRRVGTDAHLGPARCVDTRPADDVQVLGSATRDEVYVAVAQARSLLVTSTTADDCGHAVDLGGPGDDPQYGQLAQSGRYVFVPDRASGTTAVVDTAAGAVLDHVALAEPGHRLELRAQDGFVFFNDLAGHTAGVLTLRGGLWSATSLEKYDPATGEGAQVVAPADERPPVTADERPDDPADDVLADGTDGAAAPGPRPTAPPGGGAATPPGGGTGSRPPGGPDAGPRPAPTAGTPTPTPSPTAAPLTVTLGTDPPSGGQPEYQPFTSATVVATVTGAGPGATWTWQASSASSDPPVFTPPAPGDPLVLDSVGGGDVTVRLTVTDGARSGSAELLLWVKYECHVTINGSGGGAEHVVDLRSSSSGTFTVEARECREPQTVSVAHEATWLTVSTASLVVPADGSPATVTVTQTAAAGGPGVVRVTFRGTSGEQVYDVQVLPDEAPVVVDATACRVTTALREDGRTVGTRVTTVVDAVVLDLRVGQSERHTVTGDDGRTLTYVGAGGGSSEHAYRVTEVVDIRLDDPAAPPDPPGPATSVTARDGYGATSTGDTRTTTDCG